MPTVPLDDRFYERYLITCRPVYNSINSLAPEDVALIFNSLDPGRFESNLRKVIFKLILMIGDWGIFCKIALKWMSMDLTDDKSTLVQVMAWCHQATSHYLSQCWPRSMSSYDVTRPQWDLCVIFRCIAVIIFMSIFSAINFRWTLLDSNDDKSTLVQVKAWCPTAPSHHLSQCWSRSMSYCITKQQWVNSWSGTTPGKVQCVK